MEYDAKHWANDLKSISTLLFRMICVHIVELQTGTRVTILEFKYLIGDSS